MTSMERRLGVFLGPSLLILGWLSLTVWPFHVMETRLPGPLPLWQALTYGFSGPLLGSTLLLAIVSSSFVVVIGFMTSTFTGLIIGSLMGLSRYAEAAINPIFQLLRPIPPLAWIPLDILWFGLGYRGELFIVWIGSMVPVVINTFTAVRNTDPLLVSAAAVHGAKRHHILIHVVLPGSLPFTFAGFRLSLQMAWMSVVAAELVGAANGLGLTMITASRDLDSATIAVTMLFIAALGIAMTAALNVLERKVCRWE